MNEIVKGLLIVVGGAIIVAVPGYLFVVKENQVRIESLQKSVDEIKLAQNPLLPVPGTLKEIRENTEKLQDSLNATKLFVAQAHPDRDTSSLAAIMKLQGFKPSDFTTLAKGLRNVTIVQSTGQVIDAAPEFMKLMRKYGITAKDISKYRMAVADTPLKIPHG